MREKRIRMRGQIIALVSALSLLALMSEMSHASDSQWRLVISTEVGTCEKSIPAGLAVRNNDIITLTQTGVQINGSIEPSGAMWARMTRDKHLYRLQGRLIKKNGSGTWSSNTRLCGGKWTATRTQ